VAVAPVGDFIAEVKCWGLDFEGSFGKCKFFMLKVTSPSRETKTTLRFISSRFGVGAYVVIGYSLLIMLF
jgi:hypothetical protein